jgi:tRNA(Arg) A34 adenosine deaminase TadA
MLASMPDAPPLATPMLRAMELAWESFRSGSLGIGAVVTNGGEVLATGRNRLFESDPGEDVLAGTTLAHAEMNALAKVRIGGDRDGLELWTTLQPCLQCAGAIRLARIGTVHSLAPDPLFRGIDRARDLNEFVAEAWPTTNELAVDGWAALSLLLQTHVQVFWDAVIPRWALALPSVVDLAQALVASAELLDLAAAAVSIEEVADRLWPQLVGCAPDIERVLSQTL